MKTPQLILAAPFVIAGLLYIAGCCWSIYRKTKWPFSRFIFWILGTSCAVVSVIGPLAEKAHVDFTVHMLAHLLLGMLAPLLMVLGAPVSLLVRTLPVNQARRLTRVMRMRFFHFITDPITASILNIGGLWLLYTTNLYSLMHHSALLHVFIHWHVFLAGYVFTVSFISVDPNPHQRSYVYRTIVFIAALAGHGILSKVIYACPPAGVPAYEAELGGMLMYYGGDAIDVVIFIILCYRWYKITRPRIVLSPGRL